MQTPSYVLSLGCLLVCLLTGAVASADLQPGQVRLSGSATLIQAPTSDGNDYQLGVDYRYSSNYLYSAGVQKTTRVYSDGSKFTDQSLSAANVMVLAKRLYVDDRVTYAPNATFLPLYSVASTPHFILRSGNELGLGLKYAHYSGQDVGGVSPSYFYSFTDNLVSAVQINLIETYHVIMSEQAFVQYSFQIKHRVRLTAATGRAVEGPQLEGDFTAVALAYRYTIVPRLEIEPNVSVYRGSVRNENDLGINIAWTLR